MEIGFIISGMVNAHVGTTGEIPDKIRVTYECLWFQRFEYVVLEPVVLPGKVAAPLNSKCKTSKLEEGMCCYLVWLWHFEYRSSR